jgi:hypothetical protein
MLKIITSNTWQKIPVVIAASAVQVLDARKAGKSNHDQQWRRSFNSAIIIYKA